MSQFIGASRPVVILQANDMRLMSENYRQDLELSDFSLWGLPGGDFTSPWWPDSSIVDDQSNGMSGSILQFDTWGYFEEVGGTISRYGVVGVTRDVNNSPISGVTVKLYRTSTDEVVSTQVSDAAGNFTVTTPYYPDAHYVVMYKTGTPDIFCTTVNTLIGG